MNAYTRKGDGDRSKMKTIKTKGAGEYDFFQFLLLTLSLFAVDVFCDRMCDMFVTVDGSCYAM